MEAGALLMMALAGAGYFLNREGAARNRTASRYASLRRDEPEPLPGSTAVGSGGWYLDPHPGPDQNMYEARQQEDIQRALQARANELSDAARRPAETNVIPSGLGAAVATAGAGGPLDFAEFDPNLPAERLREPFHNNMQPFFRGSVKQTAHAEPYANKLAVFTGTRESFQPEGKQEVENMFSMQPNHLPDPGYAREEDRYIASYKRQGEKPFEPEQMRYKPLTNDDYVPPVKDVDELRGPLQPKLNAEGRVIQGRSIQVSRGLVGEVAQHRPPRFAEQEAEDMLPSKAAVAKQRLDGAVVDRPTHRQSLHTSVQGNAGPVTGGQVSELRATAAQAPKRINFMGEFIRNLWNKYASPGAKDDYGREGVRLPPTLRAKYLQRERAYGNVQAKTRTGHTDVPDTPDTTRREIFVHNRRAGNVKGTQRIRKAGPAPETTLKETTVYDAQRLNLASHTYKGTVAAGDKARTTVKETQLHNGQRLNLRGGPYKGVAAAQDRMRTTVKETNLHDAQRLNLRGFDAPRAVLMDKVRKTVRETIAGLSDTQRNLRGGAQKHRVANMDGVRTTVRETTTHEPRTAAQMGGLASTHGKRIIDKKTWQAKTTLRELWGGKYKYGKGNGGGEGGIRVARFNGRSAIPDRMRTTVRETLTSRSGTRGTLAGKLTGGYLVRGVDAPETARQTLHRVHRGAVYKRDNRGYLVRGVEAPETARQHLHHQYTGTAGNQNEAMMDRCYAENFQDNDHREETLVRRAPTEQKTKVAQGADRIHLDPRKDVLDASGLPKPVQRTTQRIPAKETWGEDSRGVQGLGEMSTVDHRLDPSLLDAFRANPFTQSLQSAAKILPTA